ncbi:MAG: phenylalanine--tRNA ligase subunit beta [Candidatus Omnitrophica bacterium]|nr:phenylalanine--tRNA ligase subunit beta [Candidatus Omnitrophota bacterium]
MRISYNWLKEYVDIKESPEDLSDTLMSAGLPTESIEAIGSDKILEVEVTANRPDWLSYIGVAREVAAITGRKLKIPKIEKIKTPDTKEQIKIRVEDRALCPIYTARIIKNVKVGESPSWLKVRLEAMGLRPVNNIVDITNFCLFETGEPMHAFDLDKLSGGEVLVRKAKKGEKIIAIDGVERTLEDSMLVIADSSKPVAIAGVMGGLKTEVNYSTKNILLEAAYFEPISIRRTSRKLSLSSDSSYRFERRIDISNIIHSSDRATGLICQIAGGQAGKLIDIGAKPDKKKPITLNMVKLESVLGHSIPLVKAKKILSDLGLKPKGSSREKLSFEAPYFRYDLKDEVDLIEEVARVYGYNKIRNTIPPVVEQPERLSSDIAILRRVRTALTGLGMDEIITYSLLSKKTIANAALAVEDAVCVANPLSIEQEAMRPSLVPGMLGAVLWNINRKAKDLKLFEIGHIYGKDGSNFTERQYLGLCVTGEISNWAGGSRNYSFFDLKGVVETLFDSLGVKDILFASARDCRFSDASCASIELAEENIGIIGEVDPSVLNDFDIKSPVYTCEIYLDKLYPYISTKRKFEALPKYPSVSRDISIVADKDTSSRKIMSVIRGSAGAVLKDVRLVDRYSGKQIPDGKISLTYRVEYQNPIKTLEEKEVMEAHGKILHALGSELGAKLR